MLIANSEKCLQEMLDTVALMKMTICIYIPKYIILWYCSKPDSGDVLQEFKDSSIVTIFKEVNRAECGNYRRISLLSVAGKIPAKVSLNRLQNNICRSVLSFALFVILQTAPFLWLTYRSFIHNICRKLSSTKHSAVPGQDEALYSEHDCLCLSSAREIQNKHLTSC